MKKAAAILSLLIFSISSMWCETPVLNIGVLNGPSAVPGAYIMEKEEGSSNSSYNFQIFSGADLELPKLLKGEIDIGVLPPNAAAKVWNNSKGNLLALAVVGEGNVSLLTTNLECKSLSDILPGSTIYCAGRGATPEYMFRYILKEKNIPCSNNSSIRQNALYLDFSIPNPEIAAALFSGKAEYILVPEPFATVALMQGKNKGVKKVTTLSEEYASLKSSNDNFPMTLLVCNKKVYEEKKEVIEAFLSEYKTAVTWTNENPTEAGRLVEKHTLGLKANIASASIPNGAYVFYSAKDSKKKIENLLKIFLDQNEDSIGGKLPGNDLYK